MSYKQIFFHYFIFSEFRFSWTAFLTLNNFRKIERPIHILALYFLNGKYMKNTLYLNI